MGERSSSGALELHFKKDDIFASAEEIDGEFVALRESEARRSWVGVAGRGSSKLRNKLEHDGVLVPDAEGIKMLLAQNYAFASPSAAAAALVGRSANGSESWIHKTSGLSYAKWQDQGLERAIEDDNGLPVRDSAIGSREGGIIICTLRGICEDTGSTYISGVIVGTHRVRGWRI